MGCKYWPCQKVRKLSKLNNDPIIECEKCGKLTLTSISYKRYDPELGKSTLYCPDCSDWAKEMKRKYGH